MRIGSHEYANEAADDDVLKPAQSLGTPVPRQKYNQLRTPYHDLVGILVYQYHYTLPDFVTKVHFSVKLLKQKTLHLFNLKTMRQLISFSARQKMTVCSYLKNNNIKIYPII